MIVTIKKSIANGRVKAPPSKSMAHRYLICAALSHGESIIKGLDFSNDINATISCLKSLGAKIKIEENTVKAGMLDINKSINNKELYCNESGSTLRFIIPLCLLFNQEITLNGSERLLERSLSVYQDIALSQNISFKKNKSSVTVNGKLTSGKYAVRGDISSQFISGLMFALPLLKDDSIIDITSDLESASYLALTIKALADFGVRISRLNENNFTIKGSQIYKSRELTVEGDYSNAAFLDAFNTIGGNVAVCGLPKDSAQGDMVYKEYFKMLIKEAPTIDISDCPDLGPVLMTVAALNNGAEFTGTHRLKIKESDRGEAMTEELAKFGCKVVVKENSIKVYKCDLHSPVMPLSSHNDHRIAMALSIISSVYGGSIYGAEAVSKSFPTYFEKLLALGIDLKVEN